MPFNVDDALEKLSEQRAEISRLRGLLERALPFVKSDADCLEIGGLIDECAAARALTKEIEEALK